MGLEFERLIDCFDLRSRAADARALRDALPVQAPPDWRSLASLLALACAAAPGSDAPVVLGISGGQGAGKTTLSALLVQAVSRLNRHAVALSLDDFYLPKRDRQHLGRTVHPLLATRGVPGTHDVALAVSVIDQLRAGQPVQCPVFDKAADDRLPAARFRPIDGGVSLVIFEGWCVGAVAQPDVDLVEPVNDLERHEDVDGRWRRHVNACLGRDYPALWQRLDALLYLAVPDMTAVVRWRGEQEAQHPPAQRMSRPAIERFVAHYERLTCWMGETLPEQADMVGFLDKNHALAGFHCRAT